MGSRIKNSADHRAKLTRIMIREALLGMLAEKPVGSVTVSELCRAAGISRSTFYAHYATPEDVLDDLQNSLIEEMRPYSVSSGMTVYDAMLGVLEANLRNKQFWMLTVNDLATFTLFGNKMTDILTEFGKIEDFSDNPSSEESVRRFKEQAAIAGSQGIVMDWMRRGMVEPPELVAKAVEDFVSMLDTPIGGILPKS